MLIFVVIARCIGSVDVVDLHMGLGQSPFISNYTTDSVVFLPGSRGGGEYELELPERAGLLDLIEMANNAYYDHDLDTLLFKVGYDRDGLRIKVFEYDGRVVVAFKGTTLSLAGLHTGKTSRKDKILDGILYSYCPTDDDGCVERKIRDFNNIGYFNDAVDVLDTVRGIHSGRDMLLIGHSLGGTLASLVGIKYNLPVLAFSSAGDAYMASILGLYDTDKDYNNIVHIGMCNDAVFRGECDGPYSPCGIMGYRIKTKCHVGRSFCIRDSSSSHLIYHPISTMRRKIETFGKVVLVESETAKCTY